MDKIMILFMSLNLLIGPSISANSTTTTTSIPLPTSVPTTPPTTELGTTSTTASTTTTTTTTSYQNDLSVKLALQVGIPTVVTTLTSSTPLEVSIGSPLDPAHQFWIFEAHSQYTGIALSKESPKLNDNQSQFPVLNHPGIVVLRREQISPKVFLSTKVNQNVSVLLLVRGYTADSPVPGFDDGKHVNSVANGQIEAVPFLNITWNEHLVRLRFSDAGHLSNPNVTSSTSDWIFRYRVYQHYLEEHDYDETNYLAQMAGFLMIRDISSTGKLVSDSFVRRNVTPKTNEVIFGAYPGTAALYTVIVTTSLIVPNGSELTFSTVYVGSSTYACNLDESLPLNCKVMWLTITKVVCAFSVFIGLFIALLGHRYFQVTQFFFGIFAGYIVGYILVDKFTFLGFTGTLGLSASLAVIFAALWSCLWFFCGIPLLATVLPTSVLGLLLGCILVFLPPLNITSMTDDTTYWLSVAAFTLGTPLVLLSFTQSASILSCAIVGTYAIVTPIDHYIGSNLKYILVNVVRRATVQDFNMAVIYFPFQTNDIALVAGWIGLFIVSWIVQRFRERNRAPFPPNMYQQWRWRREERNSLSENASNAASESSPLLFSARQEPTVPAENHAYMSPRRLNAPRSTRTPTPGATPVVGYIEGYGSTSLVPSPIYRAVQMPEFYERRTTTASTSRSAPSVKRQLNLTPTNQMTHEDSDIFRPPDN